MGQKKRSAASRQVAPINGSLPAMPASLQETSNLPLPLEAESFSNGSGDSCNGDGSLLINEELVVVKGNPEKPKSGGALETSRVCEEDVLNVRSECEKALVALRRGNSTKALKLIRDACSRHESNALVQRVHGHICMRLASMIEDSTTKQRHLKEAIKAAHKAVLLSPRSVEYSQFHAQLLFEVATDSKGYEEVVQECKRALEIEDPIDPAKESLHEEGQHKLPTPEARIAQVQQELQNLIQKANIASISNWMKTLGNGGSEEKLRFIHMRKLVDDPMEQRISQPKRPHEVKKSVKTPEEKRKDIEVRVAAARLLQQKRDCSPPHSDDGDLKATKGVSRLERRKTGGSNSRKLNQAQNTEERMERLKPFWKGLDSRERERMLEVSLDALKQQFNSPKMSSTLELLTEALEFAQEKKTWRFWMCCCCEERFMDCHEHAEHVMHNHIDSLSSKLRQLLPHEIDQDIADQILSEDSQPFDGPAAIKLLIESCQAAADEEVIASHLSPIVETTGCHCLGDVRVSSRETCLDDLGDSLHRSNGDTAGDLASFEPSSSPDDGEKRDETHSTACLCDGKFQRLKKVLQVGRDFKRHELPLAEDEERTKLLQKVFNLFGILIRNKCLASDHMEKIVQYALDELQSFIPDSSIQYEFNHSPIYIRFLPVPQLRRIFGYLRELVNACGVEQPSDNVSPSVPQNEEDDVILDRLFLNGDFTALTLDERLTKGTFIDNPAKQPSSSHEMDSPSNSLILKEGEIGPQADVPLLWIYQKADYELQPSSWKQFRESRTQQGRDILQALEKEFISLQNFCDRKREHLQYEEAVIMAETLCIEELKKREPKVDGSFLGHEAVLRRHQQEILESRTTGLLSPQQKLELEVITSILREAQTINLPQFPYDSAVAVTSSRLSDSDDEEEDSWRVPDVVPQLDTCIEVAIQRQKERSTSEVNKLDARILRSMDSVQRLELKLGNSSVLDYQSVVLPLVKSFLKGQLEDAAEKDALQKSDAARDAFLAELSQDKKIPGERLPDSGKNPKERSKERKKNKEQRRFKDGKRLSGVAATQQVAGNGLAVFEIDEDDEDNMEVVEVEEETQQVLEAELRRQAEVEDEERKLAETLELQRRVEEEAKEKHLAELKKRQAEREAQGITQSERSNSLSQIWGDYFPLPHNEADTVSQLFEQTRSLDSSVTSNSIHGICGNPSMKGNGIGESLLYNFTADLCTEQPFNGSNERGVSDDVCIEIQSLDDLTKLKNNHASSHDSESLDSSSSRSKRSGKNRRRKVTHSLKEDSGSRLPSEENNTSGGQYFEQSKRFLRSDEKEVCNGADNGVKPREAGLAWKKKQNSSENRVPSKTQSSNKTLRELKAEQDAEDRFQADLEQAMQQSLANVADLQSEVFKSEMTRNDILFLSENKGILVEEVGKGLQNESGQYNCFLNVVIQSLWHLQEFREEILAISSINHMHMGDPCVVCALREIFAGLDAPVSDMIKEAVAPTTLRIALSNLYLQKDFFQEAQMNDASEVLAEIFDCLHKAFTVNSVLSDGDSDTSSGAGFWECQDHTPCAAHRLFALDVAMQMNCTNCGLESRHLKYTSFFHDINANSLRTARILYQESSFDELLRLVNMNQFLGCDMEVGGCGQQNYIHHLLRAAPHVFITVLGWQNTRESLEDISATMDAISEEMDVGVVYQGLDKGLKHRLVSVICYYGQHYHCFAFNHEAGRWVMFDDMTVKVIGSYGDVVDTCRRGHLQPQVLFYEALPRYG